MYFIGIVPEILLISNPLFEFVLCVERCILLTSPYKYFYRWKKFTFFSLISFSAAAIAANLWIYNFIWFPSEFDSECQYFTCIISVFPISYIIVYKIIFAVGEISIGLILLYLIKSCTKETTSNAKKKKNMVVLSIIWTTVCLELIPDIFDLIVYKCVGLNSESIIGPYRTTFSSFNLVTSAVLYIYVLKPQSSVTGAPIFVK
uniref:G-protein coupled receptors family 1 profile domain-containing protein n=1 Tax=Panagrolaimus sp. PS1159 TaxID=55785 RepID=A0AC35FXD8_9BILA